MTMKASHDYNIPNRHIFRTLVKKTNGFELGNRFS